MASQRRSPRERKAEQGQTLSDTVRERKRVSEALSIWPSLFGGVFFSFGAYLMCLESMLLVFQVKHERKLKSSEALRNVMRGRESWKTNLFNVKSIFVHLAAVL